MAMKKLVLASISILAVVLLVLGSQANVVGYQTVQSSVKERLNEKDLLFQTICDLSNNKEVQKAILESQGKFQNPFPSTQLTTFPTITKRQLNIMYSLGVVLSKEMSKTRMVYLLSKSHPIMTNQTREKIDAIISNNTNLNEELSKLSVLSKCQCSLSNGWHPVICTILFPLYILSRGHTHYYYPQWIWWVEIMVHHFQCWYEIY
jgi:hypothetical protein